MYYYSKSTGGFYHRDIHSSWPADSVEITEEFHRELLDAQGVGKVITADDSGNPIAIDRPPPSVERLASEARAERDRLLREVYDVGTIILRRGIRLAAGNEAEVSTLSAKLAELDEYAIALLDVPQQPEFPTTINWPEEPTP